MPQAAIRIALHAAGIAGDGPIEMIGHGQSGDLVARASDAVVKLAPAGLPHNVEQLAREIEVMRWLGERASTPVILWSGPCEAGLALVMQALPGTAVSHIDPANAETAMIAAIETLAALHGLDPAGCPFDLRLDVKFAQAEARVAAGLVDEDDFDDERAGWTAAQALAHARAARPATERLVPTHGDACLPNFIWSPQGGVAMLDLGRFGLADPYQDLALFLRSAKFNFPHLDAAALLRKHYPLAEVDEAACGFYRLMDELF